MIPKEGEEITSLLRKMEEGSSSVFSNAGVRALLAGIPVAGSSLLTLVTEFESKNRTEKICDALSFLEKKIKDTNTKVENILTADQVGELLHRTLQEISISSEEKQVKYLENALARSFTTTDVPFEQKKFYMSAARQLSAIEITVLECLYKMDDPFAIDVRPGFISSSTLESPAYASMLITLQLEIHYEDKPDVSPLVKILADRTEIPEHFLAGVVGSLMEKACHCSPLT